MYFMLMSKTYCLHELFCFFEGSVQPMNTILTDLQQQLYHYQLDLELLSDSSALYCQYISAT